MDLLPNALHVARREYFFRVRSRTFVITTALIAVAILAVTMLPTILAGAGLAEPTTVAVHVDAEDLPSDPVQAIQAVLIARGDPEAALEDEEPAPDAEARARVTRTADPEAAAADVRAEELDGLLTIRRDEGGDLAFEYLTDAGPTNETRILITQAANAIAISDRLERAGVSAGESAELFRPADFEVSAADAAGGPDESDLGGSLLVTYVVVLLTFMAILTYGQWVAQSVAEEKSGRVMELLITAATPRQLLTGKVLGTGAAGLTQYFTMIAAAIVGLLASGPIADALGVAGQLPFSLPDLEASWIVAFTVFFIGGFVLYSTLYAAAGSMVSRIEDVQQAVGPLIYLAMAGYFAAFVGMNDPDAGWVQIAALIPFFSPYLMPARMLLSTPSTAEVLLAIGLLAAAVVAAIWLASRVYSAGVLMYGQRPGLRTVLRATRMAR